MTPAEQMAERLENMTPFIDGDEGNFYNAASMIRRLSAALVDAKRLVHTHVPRSSETTWLREHNDALRDVGAKV